MMSRTVLLVCEYASLNGGERSILATFDAVRRSGFELLAAAPAHGPLAEALAACAVELLPWSTGADRSLPRRRAQLAEILRRRRVDLLHANSLAMGRLSGPVARAARVPSLSHLRDIVGLSRQAIDDLNCHGRLLAVSQAVREFHVAAGLDADRTQVLYNGVDLDLFQPRPATGYLHQELSLPPEAVLVGTIGQIGLRKGHDVLVEAAHRLAARFPTLHWLLVGCRYSNKDESRRFEADLHRAAAPLGERIHFLGPRDDVPRLLNELTLLVHPARQEPLGRVLLEAAAAGTAVVATDVGGTREIFPPEAECARLVPPDDPAALVEAVAALLADPVRRRQSAARARRRAEEHFPLARAAVGLVEHYRAVASARGA
jgi:glycosyltransferase involved in cell wall biosynthesis